jgi:hypothetical protein
MDSRTLILTEAPTVSPTEQSGLTIGKTSEPSAWVDAADTSTNERVSPKKSKNRQRANRRRDPLDVAKPALTTHPPTPRIRESSSGGNHRPEPHHQAHSRAEHAPITQVRHNLPIWVPWLVCPTVLTGVGLVVFMVYQGSLGKTLEPPSFFMALFLLLFSLGTLTAMLFVTSEKFTISSGNISVALVGPAAIWLGGTFAIMMNDSMKDTLFASYKWPTTIAGLEDTILAVERGSGWIPYSDWKIDNRDYHDIIVKRERKISGELLENAFSFPSSDRNLLKRPKIVTAFLYFNDAIIKLQAISGRREEGATQADIFFANRASGEKDPLKAIFFAGNHQPKPHAIWSGLTEHNPTADRFGWVDIQGDKWVHCLIVAKYSREDPKEDMRERQDWLVTDMKKFSRHPGTLDLAILNYGQEIESVMWRMKASVGTTKRLVPLIFNPTGSRHQDHAAKVLGQLVEWMPLLDAYEQGTRPSSIERNFLKNLKKDLLQVKAPTAESNVDVEKETFVSALSANLDDHTALKGKSAWQVERAEDVNVTLVKPKRY